MPPVPLGVPSNDCGDASRIVSLIKGSASRSTRSATMPVWTVLGLSGRQGEPACAPPRWPPFRTTRPGQEARAHRAGRIPGRRRAQSHQCPRRSAPARWNFPPMVNAPSKIFEGLQRIAPDFERRYLSVRRRNIAELVRRDNLGIFMGDPAWSTSAKQASHQPRLVGF